MLQYRPETRKEREEEARLTRAIASIEVIAEWNTCKVASTTDPTSFYFVDYNKHFYAVSCGCIAHEHGMDCVHKLAVDRYFDDVRPSFHEMCGTAELVKGLAWFRQQAQQAEQEEVNPPAIVTVGEAITSAVEGVEAVIEEEAVAGDRSYMQAAMEVILAVESAYVSATVGDAYEQLAEREARETARAYREIAWDSRY